MPTEKDKSIPSKRRKTVRITQGLTTQKRKKETAGKEEKGNITTKAAAGTPKKRGNGSRPSED